MVLDKNFNRQINRALKYSIANSANIIVSINSILEIEDLKKITNNKSFEWIKELYSEFEDNSKNSLEIMQDFLVKITLPADMLRKVDSMTMANSIEVRVPLLDNRVVDFALSLPVDYLYRNGVKKSILRDVAKRYLPEDVIEHKKWGFSIPMHKVLEKELIEKYNHLFDQYDILNKDFIGKFKKYKNQNINDISYDEYSQYAIDHINWMFMLFYRWLDSNQVEQS